MTFNSFPFFIFLSIVFPLFFILKGRQRILFLLAASFYFYGFWSVKYLLLLIGTMGFDYWIALRIEQGRTENTKKRYLILSLFVNLGMLAFFKYLGLFTDMIQWTTGINIKSPEIILPFGVSFYTFHAMSYVIDVYRRVIPAERDFVLYSSYVMFFPQLVAGPIARASHLLNQFSKEKKLTRENLVSGGYLVLKGYLYKVVFADSFGQYVDSALAFDAPKNSLFLSQAIYFFAFQIYFDFNGYTLIARGIARWFDFDLVENFSKPYFASSLTDFWHRWHISLSTWLRDYLYISLGGNRFGKIQTYRNLIITMFLGGLWHGGSFNFGVWGLLHGGFLAIEKWGREQERLSYLVNRIPRPLRVLVVFHLVCFAWIFFRSTSTAQSIELTHNFISFLSHPIDGIQQPGFARPLWSMAVFAFVFEAIEDLLSLPKFFEKSPRIVRVILAYCAIVFISLFAPIQSKAFIYFQF